MKEFANNNIVTPDTPFRHSREGGGPLIHIAQALKWFTAFAGMTRKEKWE